MATVDNSIPTLRSLGFYEAPDVAHIVKVKLVTLANWRAAGIGPPFVRVHGNCVAYPISDFRAWLESRKVKPANAPTLIDRHNRRSTAA